MKPDHDGSLRRHLIELLKGGSAHARFEEVVAGILPNYADRNRPGCPTLHGCCWSTCASRSGTSWSSAATGGMFHPIGPKAIGRAAKPRLTPPPGTQVSKFRRDLKTMENLVTNPKIDLHARIAWGEGQTMLREACWWPTTTRTTWPSSWTSAVCSGLGWRSRSGTVSGHGVEDLGLRFSSMSRGRFRNTA